MNIFNLKRKHNVPLSDESDMTANTVNLDNESDFIDESDLGYGYPDEDTFLTNNQLSEISDSFSHVNYDDARLTGVHALQLSHNNKDLINMVNGPLADFKVFDGKTGITGNLFAAYDVWGEQNNVNVQITESRIILDDTKDMDFEQAQDILVDSVSYCGASYERGFGEDYKMFMETQARTSNQDKTPIMNSLRLT